MKRSQTKGVLILLLTAFIWGSAFVAQFLGANTLQGFTFNALRCLFALLFLIPVLLIVSIVIFMLIHLVPGDPAAMMLGDKATPEQIAALKETGAVR